MQKHRPITSTTPATTTNVYDAKQIIDVLPSYISLYNSSTPTPTPTPDRLTILKWFATLSPSQRVAHLTIVDPTFTQLILRMLRHGNRNHNRRNSSHVTFFILPDMPTSSSRDLVPLPSVLTRRSRGLLARIAAESTRSISLCSSLQIFSSREDVTTPYGTGSLDTLSFKEGFVADLDEFLGVMDAMSNYGFLNGNAEDWEELGLDWAEMRWLKGKGYYSLEEFVVHRVEIALRMGWLSANLSGGVARKKGVKLKEKAKNVVGLGLNVYWRKSGCIDWWERLDPGMKRKIFRTVIGMASRSLV